MIGVLLAVAVGYLLGSIPTAVVVARAHGIDPRAVGDRNPGYWNVKAQLGRRAALPVFAGDALKGTAAALVGLALADGRWWPGYLAVGAAMLGHAWPVFAGFRGGRSILTFVGGMVVLAPVAALVAAAACLLVTLVTRSFAYGARVGVFGFPLVQLLVDPATRVAATGGLMCIIGMRFALAAASRTGPATGGPAAAPPS